MNIENKRKLFLLFPFIRFRHMENNDEQSKLLSNNDEQSEGKNKIEILFEYEIKIII